MRLNSSDPDVATLMRKIESGGWTCSRNSKEARFGVSLRSKRSLIRYYVDGMFRRFT